MLKIVCSAIKVMNVSPELNGIYLGPRHNHCFEAMTERRQILGLNHLSTWRVMMLQNNIQGFITSRNEFVTRTQAKEIAMMAGQIPKDFSHKELHSEDLY